MTSTNEAAPNSRREDSAPKTKGRPTASTITDAQLDRLHERLDKQARALDRADALAEEWADDNTPVTRRAAAELFATVLEPDGWEQTDATHPGRHLAAVPAKETK